MELTWRNFWFEGKDWVSEALGLSKEMLHVHLGLALFLAAALALRTRRRGLLVAWLAVAALQAANEALDARDWIMWTGSVNWAETARDTVATLFWPTVIALIWARATPLRRAEWAGRG